MSLQRVVGFLLRKSCFMTFAQTSVLPCAFFCEYCCEPSMMVSEPFILLILSMTESNDFSVSISNGLGICVGENLNF